MGEEEEDLAAPCNCTGGLGRIGTRIGTKIKTGNGIFQQWIWRQHQHQNQQQRHNWGGGIQIIPPWPYPFRIWYLQLTPDAVLQTWTQTTVMTLHRLIDRPYWRRRPRLSRAQRRKNWRRQRRWRWWRKGNRRIFLSIDRRHCCCFRFCNRCDDGADIETEAGNITKQEREIRERTAGQQCRDGRDKEELEEVEEIFSALDLGLIKI